MNAKPYAGKPGFLQSRIAWLICAGMLGAAVMVTFTTNAFAQAGSNDDQAKLAREEKEACTKNLRLIYEAIQVYQSEKKDIPNWLSDLVPQYLTDANVLICPVCKRTGKGESTALADPKISTSYLYEFCPLPLDKKYNISKTRRDWKRRQMGLAGSVVPIVRCRQHGTALNLAFDGKVYESPTSWERLLTNRLNIADLSVEHLFASEISTKARPAAKPIFPRRDPLAKPGLVNLSEFYNAALTESWHGGSGNSFAALPAGLQTLGGVEWDLRGLVQLGSKSPSAISFPEEVKGIKVHQKCQRLQFLHAAGFGSAADEGTQIGTYVIHLATNHMHLELPIIYGHDARNWHALADEPPAPKELVVAWTGTNAVSKSKGMNIRLFKTTWVNLVPEAEVESIDFVSSMATPAPFLVAITAEK
jgi:hypothetical protein